MADKSWHNVALTKLSVRAQAALKNKLDAARLSAEANREWQQVINEDFGPLPEGKRFAVNLNLKFQNIGLKIVDAEEEVERVVKAPKQSFEDWKAQQIANGYAS